MDFKRTGPETVQIITRDGRRILFSYGEPVAVFFPTEDGTCWRTNRYVSATTERHIKEFVADGHIRPARVSPEALRRLLEEIG